MKFETSIKKNFRWTVHVHPEQDLNRSRSKRRVTRKFSQSHCLPNRRIQGSRNSENCYRTADEWEQILVQEKKLPYPRQKSSGGSTTQGLRRFSTIEEILIWRNRNWQILILRNTFETTRFAFCELHVNTWDEPDSFNFKAFPIHSLKLIVFSFLLARQSFNGSRSREERSSSRSDRPPWFSWSRITVKRRIKEGGSSSNRGD